MGYYVTYIFFAAIAIMARNLKIETSLTLSTIVAVIILIAAAARGFSPMVVLAVLGAFVLPHIPITTVAWFGVWCLIAIVVTANTPDDGSAWGGIADEIFEAAFYLLAVLFATFIMHRHPDVQTAAIWLGASWVVSFMIKNNSMQNQITKRIIHTFSASVVAYFVYIHVNYSMSIKI
ncbi:MAG: hypothetical protein ABIK73_07795 [candidate division WOR-3 bacterium]